MVQLLAINEKITKIRFDIIVLGFMKDVRPLKGIASDIDWVYSGAISRMIMDGKINGVFGEALLMATNDKMNTPRLLLIGMGDKNGFSYDSIRKFSSNLTDRLRELKLGGGAVELPVVQESTLNKVRLFDSFMSGFNHSNAMDLTILVKDDAVAEEFEERIPL